MLMFFGTFYVNVIKIKMSSEYYFRKWKNTITKLDNLIRLDVEYQESKAHDQQWCDAVERLSGVLGCYIDCYNDAADCLHQNLQIQKTVYITDVVNGIVARILELKEQLRKLEGSCCQFLGNSIIDHKLTAYDVEFSRVPNQFKRPQDVENAVREALQEANNRKEEKTLESDTEKPNEVPIEKAKWWENEDALPEEEHRGINITKQYEVEQKISEETLKRKDLIALIQAHEKTRQITKMYTQQKQRRERWEKELRGMLNPSARRVLREKSARIIQTVMRSYFRIKRDRLRQYKRDELLQIKLFTRPNNEHIEKDREIKQKRHNTYNIYEEQWKVDCDKYIESLKKRKGDEFADDFRDCIRDWFQKWYVEAKYFYDIPKENQGGCMAIIKEEIPSPPEWLQQYETYLEEKKSNKNKTAQQLKWEKLAAKEEEMMLKREELKKKKLEAQLLKKMKKNPALHPGYDYPLSRKVEHLSKLLVKYNEDWSALDSEERIDVKESYVKDLNQEHLCMVVKMDICKDSEQCMREELKVLKKALVDEYKRNEEVLPCKIPEKQNKSKKKKIKSKKEDIGDKLINLAENGILKECPATNFDKFLGDSNYAGDDLRCSLRSPLPFGGEIRSIWWERCREVMHGFRKILLVGPKESGKTTLAHIMATECDAVFYELDPSQIAVENQTTEHLKQIINYLVVCAKATQPSVILIKNINLLFYSKVPPEYVYMKLDLIKQYFTRNLFKKIHKNDNITIIGSCINPWMMRSKQLIKKFKSVLLLPDTNYSAVQLILRNWVLNNRIVPSNLDTHSLAYALKGYPFGVLVKLLEEFLTADRIVKIAAFGLTSNEVYNYILDHNDVEIDYNKYVNWYTNNTYWGMTERKHLDERLEFKAVVDEWNEKIKKKEQKTKKVEN